jgi:hypothetical protein
MYKVRFELADVVQRVVVFTENNEFICKFDRKGNVFTGVISEKKIRVVCLADSGTASYVFNDLFSKPISAKALQTDHISLSVNTVVVNTPSPTNDPSVKIETLLGVPVRDKIRPTAMVMLAIPTAWRTFAKLQKYYALQQVPQDKLKFAGTCLERGIDPAGDTWMVSIPFTFPPDMSALLPNSLNRLLKAPITVVCYFDSYEFSYDVVANCKL